MPPPTINTLQEPDHVPCFAWVLGKTAREIHGILASRARGALALGIAVLALVSGCSTTIDADDYERSCQQDSECVIISVGDICDCGCDVSAINQVDLAKYFEDRNVDCGKQCGPCPEAPPAVCVAGICQAGP